MHMHHDPDEWEAVSESSPCTACGGDMRKCNGMCNGMSKFYMRRRAPEEVAKIKAEKRHKREIEILTEAAAIMRARKINK